MATEATRHPVETRQYRSSFRLIFRDEGERIHLREAVRLQKIASGTALDPPNAGEKRGACVRGTRPRMNRDVARPPLRRSTSGEMQMHLIERLIAVRPNGDLGEAVACSASLGQAPGGLRRPNRTAGDLQ